MAHVELSLPAAFVPLIATSDGTQQDDSFGRWVQTVATAAEPCLVIDTNHRIVAASTSCCSLLDLDAPATAVGRPLSEALRLVDFTAARSELAEPEIEKIPPLLAITSGRLARGLLRIQSGGADEAGATVDAVATPLFRDLVVAGSLTFFSEV